MTGSLETFALAIYRLTGEDSREKKFNNNNAFAKVFKDENDNSQRTEYMIMINNFSPLYLTFQPLTSLGYPIKRASRY